MKHKIRKPKLYEELLDKERTIVNDDCNKQNEIERANGEIPYSYECYYSLNIDKYSFKKSIVIPNDIVDYHNILFKLIKNDRTSLLKLMDDKNYRNKEILTLEKIQKSLIKRYGEEKLRDYGRLISL